MKQNNQVIWGIILVLVGLVLGLNACGLANIHLFFNGWWTLFIIVPSLIGFLSGKDRGSNLIGLGIGAVDLNLTGSPVDYQIRLDKGIGSATMDGKSLSGGSTVGNGANRIDIDGGIGSISIHFVS